MGNVSAESVAKYRQQKAIVESWICWTKELLMKLMVLHGRVMILPRLSRDTA